MLSVLNTVYEAVSDPPDNNGLLAVSLTTSPVVGEPEIVIGTLPRVVVPRVKVSVAEPVTEVE